MTAEPTAAHHLDGAEVDVDAAGAQDTTGATHVDPPWAADLDPQVEAQVVARLRRAIDRAERVVIAGHVSPDGDALGSLLALHLALGSAGAATVPVIGEQPLTVTPPLEQLPGAGELRAADRLPATSAVDLLISVDAASTGRLGQVAEYLDERVETIVLDHHAQGQPFGDLRLVAPTAAATVQLVERVLDGLSLPLTPAVATCLYVGLVTDTGRFAYQATDPSAHELAGRALAAGVDQAWWHQALFATRSAAELTLLGHGLKRLTEVPDVGLVHAHVTAEEVAGCDDASVEGLVDLLRSADSAEVALALRPTGDGAWKGSLRSRGTADVGRVAAALGGGGHRLAAGFTVEGTPQEVTHRVVGLLREA